MLRPYIRAITANGSEIGVPWSDQTGQHSKRDQNNIARGPETDGGRRGEDCRPRCPRIIISMNSWFISDMRSNYYSATVFIIIIIIIISSSGSSSSSSLFICMFIINSIIIIITTTRGEDCRPRCPRARSSRCCRSTSPPSALL